MCIDDKLKNIKEYMVSLRFDSGLSIIDVLFKESWVVPTKSSVVGIQKYPNSKGKYMFYSDKDSVSIDDVADFVHEVVKVNVEREEKVQLLKAKFEELRVFFNDHTLDELKRLQFNIEEVEEEPLIPETLIDSNFHEEEVEGVMSESEDVEEQEEEVEVKDS
jgi:hypothetical protein